MIDIQAITAGAVAAVALAGGFWALGKFGPSLLVKRLHKGFEELKTSAWVRDPAKPKRAQAMRAVAELLEDEIPEPGQGQEVYDALGAGISARVPIGSAAQWAKAARSFGDAVDTELDLQLLEIASNATTPPAAS